MAKTMYVTLDITKNPKVQVDPIILGKPKLKWRRDEDSVQFDFIGISDLPKSFTTTKETEKKINVTDDMVPGDYSYTITVKKDGVEYTTTKSGPPTTDGRPVIRN